MKQRLLHIFTLTGIIFCILLVSSCTDDDDNTTDCEGTMTCTYNGKSWTSENFNNTLTKLTDQGVDGKRLDIRGTSTGGVQLILTINETRDGLNGDCIQLDTWDTFVDNNTVTGHLFLGSKIENSQLLATFPDEDAGSLTITSCDEANKTISGTFQFVITDIFGTGEELVQVVNGEFTNICYTIIP